MGEIVRDLEAEKRITSGVMKIFKKYNENFEKIYFKVDVAGFQEVYVETCLNKTTGKPEGIRIEYSTLVQAAWQEYPIRFFYDGCSSEFTAKDVFGPKTDSVVYSHALHAEKVISAVLDDAPITWSKYNPDDNIRYPDENDVSAAQGLASCEVGDESSLISVFYTIHRLNKIIGAISPQDIVKDPTTSLYRFMFFYDYSVMDIEYIRAMLKKDDRYRHNEMAYSSLCNYQWQSTIGRYQTLPMAHLFLSESPVIEQATICVS